jgi:hypothetical protein
VLSLQIHAINDTIEVKHNSLVLLMSHPRRALLVLVIVIRDWSAWLSVLL